MDFATFLTLVNYGHLSLVHFNVPITLGKSRNQHNFRADTDDNCHDKKQKSLDILNILS